MPLPDDFLKKFNLDDFENEIDPDRTIPLSGGPFEAEDAVADVTSDETTVPEPSPAEPGADLRLYFKYIEGWSVHIKQDWMKEYCYSQKPGEDYYHVLVGGEIYVQRGTEKFCLTCALRRGYVTRDRMHWQRGGARPTE